MREAVIVSYARTGLAKSGRGGFNITPAMTHGGPRHQARGRQVGRRARSRRGRVPRQRRPRRRQPRPPRRACSPACPSRRAAPRSSATARRASTRSPWPPTTSRNDGADVVVAGGVESISMPSPGFGGSANIDPKLDRDVPGDLHGDDRDRRHRRRALRRQPRVPGRVLARSRSSAWPPRRPTGCSPTRSCRWRRR